MLTSCFGNLGKTRLMAFSSVDPTLTFAPLSHCLKVSKCRPLLVILWTKIYLFPLGLEPRTSRVWSERDNHYTMETWRCEAIGCEQSRVQESVSRFLTRSVKGIRHSETMKPVADPWFPRCAGATPKLDVNSYYLANFPPKTAWNWKNLDPGKGASLAPPLDPPMEIFIEVVLKYWQKGGNSNSKDIDLLE